MIKTTILPTCVLRHVHYDKLGYYVSQIALAVDSGSGMTMDQSSGREYIMTGCRAYEEECTASSPRLTCTLGSDYAAYFSSRRSLHGLRVVREHKEILIEGGYILSPPSRAPRPRGIHFLWQCESFADTFE